MTVLIWYNYTCIDIQLLNNHLYLRVSKSTVKNESFPVIHTQYCENHN